jgi:fructose-specific phosphotransferase system component IIB
VAVGLGASPLVAHAQAVSTSSSFSAGVAPIAFFKKKKKKKKKKRAAKPEPGLSPEAAEAKRQAIRDSVASDREAGNLDAAADGLEENAALLGDPVTMKEAGAVRLEHARKERSIEAAEASIATTTVALDMLHFYDGVSAGDATSRWLVIEPSSASGLISEAEAQIAEAEALIEEIEAEQAEDEPAVAAADKPKKKKKKRGKAKPGTGFLVGGSIATAVGLGGAGLAIAGLMQSKSAQDEVEGLGGDPANQPRIDELDDEGARANQLAYIGVGVAAAGLAIGIPLIIVGAKKRREAGPSANASVRVAPMVAGRVQGLAVSGRF